MTNPHGSFSPVDLPYFCEVLTSRHVSTTTDSGSALDVPEGCAEGSSVETEISSLRNGCHGFGVCDKAVSSMDHEYERNLMETEKRSVVK